MRLSKTFIVLLSLALCFCLLSKQANAAEAWDYDIPSMTDVPTAEAMTHDDANQPIVLVGSYLYPHAVPAIDILVAETHYRQPAAPPFFRPPAL